MSDNIDTEILTALRSLNTVTEQQNKSLADMSDGIIRILERQDKWSRIADTATSYSSVVGSPSPNGMVTGVAGILVVMITSVALASSNAIESLSLATEIHRKGLIDALAQERNDRITADVAINEASKDRFEQAQEASKSRHQTAISLNNQHFNTLSERIRANRDQVQSQIDEARDHEFQRNRISSSITP